MAMVVKVRFRRASKLYDFEANGLELSTGTYIVTETVRGTEIGECMTEMTEVRDNMTTGKLKPIMRIATEEDLAIQKENEEKEKKAFDVAEAKINELNLDMKLVDVEFSFDSSKITFYFTADGRVDFRGLVKYLANVFKMRIELRQIGVRDEAKMLGGIGPCGRPICCRQFLVDFQPVSIKMAKEQNLSLNPSKISGLCDRLMCCLKYEQDHYESTRKRMPKVGKEIDTPDGRGTVSAINVLSELITVRLPVGDSYENRVYALDDCDQLQLFVAPPKEDEFWGRDDSTLIDFEPVDEENVIGADNEFSESVTDEGRRGRNRHRHPRKRKPQEEKTEPVRQPQEQKKQQPKGPKKPKQTQNAKEESVPEDPATKAKRKHRGGHNRKRKKPEGAAQNAQADS